MSAPTTPTTQATLPLGDTTERKAITWSSVSIRLDKIIDDGFNPRKDYGEHDGTLAALVDSIRQRGMLQPPVVLPVSGAADCEYRIVLGHRRIAAARALGWEYVRCTPMEDCEGLPADYTDEERLIDAMEENLQRKDLNCIEVAEGIVALEKLGMKQEEIAQKIKRSQGTVSKLSRLLLLPDGVRTHLRLGTLTQSHGEEMLPLLGECFLTGEIETLASKAVETGLSASGLRNVVREKIERATPKQVTLEEVAGQGEYSAPNSGGFDSELDARIARTLAATKGLDKEPAPAPGEATKLQSKDDNGLTRKESDAQFTAAMAPDLDVVPLSERPGVDKPKGTFFFLPADAAQLLFELSDWHRQEHGDLITADQKLADIVRSFHQAKLEMKAEGEAAKVALGATLPVFEESSIEEVKPETPAPRKYDAAVDVAWRVMRNGILDRFRDGERVALSEIEALGELDTNCVYHPKPERYLLERYELQESGLRGDAPEWGKACRFTVMLSGGEHRVDYVPGIGSFDSAGFYGDKETGVSETGYRQMSLVQARREGYASPLEWAVASGEARIAERFKGKKAKAKADKKPKPAPAPIAPATERQPYTYSWIYASAAVGGGWIVNGTCDIWPDDPLPVIHNQQEAREWAREKSRKSPTLLYQVIVDIYQPAAKTEARMGDFWYFRGEAVPCGTTMAGKLPPEPILRAIGAWDVAQELREAAAKEDDEEQAPSEGIALDLFDDAVTMVELVDDMAGRLV